MKLDATDLRYITPDEFRVLTAVEVGSKNHEVVPVPLIVQISAIRGGGVNKLVGSLAKRNLVSKVQNAKYDGYRLTYGGYDYLAMRALSKRDSMYSVGNQIGVGKESDIYIVNNSEEQSFALKIHRLGRVSFRAVNAKRDYLAKRKSASWMYLSRLAAQREWSFMKVLYEHGFPVPRPIDQSRHCILMEYIDSYPLRQISDVPSPGKLYSDLMQLIVRFAQAGLIHGDFNEFNILIRHEDGKPVVIDFPQMISTSHANAEWYFNRDVECIRTFFKRRFQYEGATFPHFQRNADEEDGNGEDLRLDTAVVQDKKFKILEKYMKAQRNTEGDSRETGDDGSGQESDDRTSQEGSDEEFETPDEPENFATSSPGVEDSSHQGPRDISVMPAKEPPPPSLVGLSGQSRSPQQPPLPPALHTEDDASPLPMQHLSIKDTVSSDLAKYQARNKRKYHSKRSARQAGRPQGSKAKQDTTVKLDNSGVWD